MAFLLGLVTLRLKGHFLSLATLAWGLSISFLFGTVDGLGSFNGIAQIPPITLGPAVSFGGTVPMFCLIWVIVAVAVLLAANLLRSRMGRAMRVLRGGNILVESLGIDAFRTRLSLFVVAALLAALSGCLDAHLGRFVSPGPYGIGPGIEYLMMAMIGGAGSLFGDMSVADTLLLGSFARKPGRAALNRSLDDVFARFPRLKERRSQLANTLSGGEGQMLALGRALMSQPRLSMLDEPSLGLAPKIVREIFVIIAGLRDAGVSILLVEQNARAALQTADVGFVLETGERVSHGAAATLLHDQRRIATHLGGA